MKSVWASTHHRMVSGNRMLGLTRTLTRQNGDSTSKARILLCLCLLEHVFAGPATACILARIKDLLRKVANGSRADKRVRPSGSARDPQHRAAVELSHRKYDS